MFLTKLTKPKFDAARERVSTHGVNEQQTQSMTGISRRVSAKNML